MKLYSYLKVRFTFLRILHWESSDNYMFIALCGYSWSCTSILDEIFSHNENKNYIMIHGHTDLYRLDMIPKLHSIPIGGIPFKIEMLVFHGKATDLRI